MSRRSKRWLLPILAGGLLLQFQGIFALLPETLARVPFTALFLPLERFIQWFLAILTRPFLFGGFGL